MLDSLEALQSDTPNLDLSKLKIDYVADEFMGIVNNANRAMDITLENDAHFKLWFRVYRVARMYAAVCITDATPDATNFEQYAADLVECSSTYRSIYPNFVEAFRLVGFTAQ